MSKPSEESIDVVFNALPEQRTKETSGLAITSMVLGIVGLIVFGIVLGPLAIIFGTIALNRIKENPHRLEGREMATAGIICGSIATAIYIVVLVFFITASLQ